MNINHSYINYWTPSKEIPHCISSKLKGNIVGITVNRKKLNVILVTIDCLRADHLHCMGYPKEISPTIDALAKNGVKFTNAFSNAPYTPYSVPSLIPLYFSLARNLIAYTPQKSLLTFHQFFSLGEGT